MLGKEAASKALEKLFRRRPVVDLESLCRALRTQSRMSVFRRLRAFDYLSSYTHAGRYYTLAEIPRFDDEGLWLYRDIGFSRAGTLKNTVAHLVEIGEAGRTHRELQQLVRVRVHNTLLSLVREERINRQRLETMYLYVSVEAERASHQVAVRRELLASRKEVALPLTSSTIIEVLLEVIQTAQPRVTPTDVAKRLTDREVPVTADQVEQIFDRYSLGPGKKTSQ
jgi:hypothetical protein